MYRKVILISKVYSVQVQSVILNNIFRYRLNQNFLTREFSSDHQLFCACVAK